MGQAGPLTVAATMPALSNIDLMQGTLDLLVLRTLTWGAMHGYAVARQIRERSREVILVEEGALYPALHRMERRGWIEAEWGLSENNRRAKFYELTAAGREQLRREVATWTRYTEAVARILAPA
jgi:PadR family transcriptional regulator, regulatory protein PadR